MPGHLSFIEIGASDPRVASQFFSQLFSWKFTPMSDGGDGWFETPTMRVGMHREPETSRVDVYFNVEDLEVAISRVKDLGGQIEEPSIDEPGFGKFCHCRAPDGFRFGLHQS